LRAVGEGDLAGQVAYRYDYVNYAHPFREGNGRSTREFFDLLLSERGSGLDWGKTDLEELHGACHVARANSDLTGLVAMFKGILPARLSQLDPSPCCPTPCSFLPCPPFPSTTHSFFFLFRLLFPSPPAPYLGYP
ncbi:Fic family protein, partial [Leuconostoc mesenteroides]|nr:Fic family protein [Leuconostoc mesenteroides]